MHFPRLSLSFISGEVPGNVVHAPKFETGFTPMNQNLSDPHKPCWPTSPAKKVLRKVS